MNKKRYSIVRVDNSCPAYEDYIFCGRIDKRFRIVDTTVDCNKCKIRKYYGDTKEQMILKVAQVLLIDEIERYRKAPNCEINKTIIEHEYRICLEKARKIVEFLGVEE